MRSNIDGERGPHLIPMGGMWPWGVANYVVVPLYRFVMISRKSFGRPRNVRVLTSWSWSAERKAPLKSR